MKENSYHRYNRDCSHPMHPIQTKHMLLYILFESSMNLIQNYMKIRLVSILLLRIILNFQLLYYNLQCPFYSKYRLNHVHIGCHNLDRLRNLDHRHTAHQFRQRDPNIDIFHGSGHYLMVPYIELY